MKNSRIFVLASLLVALVAVDACVNHDIPQYTCDSEPLNYNDDILPIVQAKCAIPDCHNGGPPLGPDYNWTVYENLAQRAESGILKFNVVNRVMPKAESPNGPLSQEQINTIACWVDQGYPEN